MSQEGNEKVSDSGAGTAKSQGVPQDPFAFLKQFVGKTVSVKAKGVFYEDLIDRSGKVLKTEVFDGYLEGEYYVQIDGFGDVLLCFPSHIIVFKRIDWIEINGKKVRSEKQA